ncbi:PREDICTED: uncharacterized protein LOC101309805 [Fragaria vesca subsp. vesca]
MFVTTWKRPSWSKQEPSQNLKGKIMISRKTLKRWRLKQKNCRKNLIILKPKIKIFILSLHKVKLRRKSFRRIMKYVTKQKEKLRKKIIQLEKELEKKQALELEIEQMRGALRTMEHMDVNEDLDAKKQMDEIKQTLKEKEVECEDLDTLCQTLMVRERRSNDELQEARKELVNGL